MEKVQCDGATDAVQTRKVRKAREALFLAEMERLADAMCRHYTTAAVRSELQASGAAGGATEADRAVPRDSSPDPVRRVVPLVPTVDIRRHIGAIQTSIQQTLLDEARALQVDAAHQAELLHDSEGERARHRTRGAKAGDSLAMAGFEGPNTRFKTVDPAPGADFLTGWQAQSAGGVAARLRSGGDGLSGPQQLPALNLGSLRGAQKSDSARTVDSRCQPSPLAISSIRTNAEDLQTMDISMDGNTACLSCRRRKPDPLYDSLRKGAPPPLPPPPLTARLPRDVAREYFRRGPSGGSTSGGDATRHTVAGRSTSRRKGTVPWSPRDDAISLATTRKEQEGWQSMAALVSRIPVVLHYRGDSSGGEAPQGHR